MAANRCSHDTDRMLRCEIRNQPLGDGWFHTTETIQDAMTLYNSNLPASKASNRAAGVAAYLTMMLTGMETDSEKQWR